MKNRIRKRPITRTSQSQNQRNLSQIPQDSPNSESLGADKKSSFWYNFATMGVIIEVMVGAIAGIGLCFGFFFAFFILRGNLIVSLAIFLVILVISAFAVLVLKYMFMLVVLKVREMELLEKIAK